MADEADSESLLVTVPRHHRSDTVDAHDTIRLPLPPQLPMSNVNAGGHFAPLFTAADVDEHNAGHSSKSGKAMIACGVTLLFVIIPLAYWIGQQMGDQPQDGLRPSLNDGRQYKAVVLSNGLQVLLVSDNTTDKASAALSVGVGSGADPETIPGLAHFLEHMLFMGTQKYPSENDYEEFLARYGGGSNAFTAEEETNFFFDVAAGQLEGALDRFSQFFISPLFAAESTAREMKAVDSEHNKNLLSDNWRFFQFIKSLAKPGSAFHHFGTGSIDTLNVTGIREALLAFHEQYYSANLMRVAILGRESLTELEALAVTYLSGIANKGAAAPAPLGVPFDHAALGQVYAVQPIQDAHSVSLLWPLPTQRAQYRSKAAEFVAYLLGHEGPATVIDVLRRSGRADSLSSGLDVDSASFGLFSCSIQLSRQTFESDTELDIVVQMVFQYIELLKRSALEAAFAEMVALQANLFRFQEPQEASSYTSSLASTMQVRALADVLGDPTRAVWAEAAVKDVLAQLTVSNALIVLSSPVLSDARLPNTEPVYGTRWGVQALTPNQTLAWGSPPVTGLLALPPRNPFRATDFDVVNGALPAESALGLLNAVPVNFDKGKQSRTWYKSDCTFRLPKVFFTAKIYCLGQQDARTHVLATLYADILTAEFSATSYMGRLAGYAWSITADTTGFTLHVEGFADRFDAFFTALTHALATHTNLTASASPWRGGGSAQPSQSPQSPQAQVQPQPCWEPETSAVEPALEEEEEQQPQQQKEEGVATAGAARDTSNENDNDDDDNDIRDGPALRQLRVYFKIRKSLLREALDNFAHDQPYRHAMYFADMVTLTTFFSTSELLAALDQITFHDWRTFVELDLFDEAYVEALVYGNVDSHGAEGYVEELQKALHADETESTRISSLKFPLAVAPQQALVFQSAVLDASNSNSGLAVVFQISPHSGNRDDPKFQKRALVDMLGMVLGEPCFNQLRTLEQLGYIVACRSRNAYGVSTFNMVVQGSGHSAAYFNSRVDTFLVASEDLVCGMEPSEFETRRQALVDSLLEKPLSMADAFNHWWSVIGAQEYEFDAVRSEVDRLRGMTVDDLCRFYRSYILPTGSERRRLSVEVFGAGFPVETVDGPVVNVSTVETWKGAHSEKWN